MLLEAQKVIAKGAAFRVNIAAAIGGAAAAIARGVCEGVTMPGGGVGRRRFYRSSTRQ